MKILDTEEREAHIAHITHEGVKGLFVGSMISAGLFAYLKFKQPVKFSHFNTSIKTCIFAMPTIASGAFFADQGSVEFDKQMHQLDYTTKKTLEEFRAWNNLSASDKFIHSLNNNKYSIIIGAWAASLYGSWALVNRDKIMTTAQKMVQARMYAQGLTIVLLLGTIVLSMKEQEMEKLQPKPIPEWQQILNDREQAKKQELLKN